MGLVLIRSGDEDRLLAFRSGSSAGCSRVRVRDCSSQVLDLRQQQQVSGDTRVCVVIIKSSHLVEGVGRGTAVLPHAAVRLALVGKQHDCKLLLESDLQ